MGEVKSSRELGFGEPKPGYEWDAGNTPPGDSAPGRWTVKRRDSDWVVIFHSFIGMNRPGRVIVGTSLLDQTGPDYIIASFPPTEDGERAAKSMALKLVDITWGRDEDKDHA